MRRTPEGATMHLRRTQQLRTDSEVLELVYQRAGRRRARNVSLVGGTALLSLTLVAVGLTSNGGDPSGTRVASNAALPTITTTPPASTTAAPTTPPPTTAAPSTTA